MEKNEINQQAKGGSELMLERLYKDLPSELLDHFQIIPCRVREVNPDKKRILWLQDLPNDKECSHLADPASRKRFDKIVFNSYWQQQMFNVYLGVPFSEGVVLPNAIYPIRICGDCKEPIHSKRTIRLIYHTTPHRGLEILVPVFEELSRTDPYLELDVYSSFSLYGQSWTDRNKPYEEIFERCRQHPKIRYHGAVTNQTIREALCHSDIFAYPCIWPETACLAAIEAMSARNVIVCSSYGVLPFTTGGFAQLYPYTEDKAEHTLRFKTALEKTILRMRQENGFTTLLEQQKKYADTMFDWTHVREDWKLLLSSLI